MMLGLGCPSLPHRRNRQGVCCTRPRLSGTRLSVVVSAAGFHNSGSSPQPPDKDGFNSPRLPFKPSSHRLNSNSHKLPWAGYIDNIFNAIEAEADANSAFKEAYNNSFHTDSSTQHPTIEGSAQNAAEPRKPLDKMFKSKLQQAMDKQDDARRFIWAAEYKASEFFRRMKNSKEHMSSRPIVGNAADAEARRIYISASTAVAAKNLEDMRAAARQGAQYAKAQMLLAMQLTQSILLKSKTALNSTADKVKAAVEPLLPEVVEPAYCAGQQKQQRVRHEQLASWGQLRELLKNESLQDMAASLAQRFQQGLTDHEMHTEEAREWLEHLWHMDPSDMAVYDRPGYTLPHTPGMMQKSANTWFVVVGLMAVMSVWPSLSQW